MNILFSEFTIKHLFLHWVNVEYTNDIKCDKLNSIRMAIEI